MFNALWESATSTGGSGASTADAVSNTPAGTISSTNVQDAINELDTEKVSYTDPHYIAAKLVVATIFGAR